MSRICAPSIRRNFHGWNFVARSGNRIGREEMVAETWILRMGNQVSNNLKHALHHDNSKKSQIRRTIGILSFEVANLMSKIIHLHKSLTDHEINRLKNEILKSEGVKTLVSSDENLLLELALAEKLDDLNSIASVVSRLGTKSTVPVLQGFEHVYNDIVSGSIDVAELRFLVKDMDSTIRKMEKYVNSTANLYSEMEVLKELEIAMKKFQQGQHHESRKAYEQKLSWQRQDIRHLKSASLWNKTYDSVVDLLARTVCTVSVRLHVVAFGDVLNVNSVPIKKEPIRRRTHNSPTAGGMNFVECLSKSSNSPISKSDSNDSNDRGSQKFIRGINRDPFSGNPRHLDKNLSKFSPENTVGASALSLHYANIIIVLEKFILYPHLIGDEARDDLYEMLPTSLRKTLRSSLRSYLNTVSIYDAPIAQFWREKIDSILSWLAPLAHNMMRWQSERNFEQQQQIVKRVNVSLLQTLYFADRAKTEAAMCELLMGLTYICRYEQQQNALLDCASSLDLDDGFNWRMQVRDTFCG